MIEYDEFCLRAAEVAREEAFMAPLQKKDISDIRTIYFRLLGQPLNGYCDVMKAFGGKWVDTWR